MAEIAPFRGTLYTSRAGDPARLLAPPYDVINEKDHEALEALDPHNCVRLILPRPKSSLPDDSKYDHAAELLRRWIDEGALSRDTRPAIYRYHQRFQTPDGEVTRKGYIARVRLRRFDEGVILPHERTLSGPKMDRLKLMRATHAHFSQIFGLYPDPKRESDQYFTAVEREAPAIEGRTSDGVLQQLWRLTDGAAIRGLCAFMADRKVYIADGHHRYETMLTLREELRPEARERAKAGGYAPERSSVEFGVMFFCNMDDPGLVVYPTHRVLHALAGFDRAELLRRAERYFELIERPISNGSDGKPLRQALAEAAVSLPAFALITPGSDRATILRLRAGADLDSAAAMPKAKELRGLDVTLLHALCFETLLGLDRAAQEQQTNLRYLKDWQQALAAKDEPGVQAVFLMNPTKVSQVRAVADVGEVMPQKSTFFYPKIASGLVVNPIETGELVDDPATLA